MTTPYDPDNPYSSAYTTATSHGQPLSGALIPYPGHPGLYVIRYWDPTVNDGAGGWNYGQTVYQINPDGSYSVYTGSAGGSTSGGGGGGGGGGGFGNQAYIDLAQSYGRNLTAQEANYLADTLHVSLDEWQSRLERARWLDENQKYIKLLEQTLKDRGILGKNGSIDPYDFIKGTAILPAYNAWQEFAGRAAADITNFEAGRGTIKKFVERLPGEQEIADLLPIFAQAGQMVKANGTWAKYKGYGLHERDWLDAAAGIIRSNKAATLQRVIAEQAEFAQIRLGTRLEGVSGRQGLVG